MDCRRPRAACLEDTPAPQKPAAGGADFPSAGMPEERTEEGRTAQRHTAEACKPAPVGGKDVAARTPAAAGKTRAVSDPLLEPPSRALAAMAEARADSAQLEPGPAPGTGAGAGRTVRRTCSRPAIGFRTSRRTLSGPQEMILLSSKHTIGSTAEQAQKAHNCGIAKSLRFGSAL